jgi:hypothetical protein
VSLLLPSSTQQVVMVVVEAAVSIDEEEEDDGMDDSTEQGFPSTPGLSPSYQSSSSKMMFMALSVVGAYAMPQVCSLQSNHFLHHCDGSSQPNPWLNQSET